MWPVSSVCVWVQSLMSPDVRSHVAAVTLEKPPVAWCVGQCTRVRYTTELSCLKLSGEPLRACCRSHFVPQTNASRSDCRTRPWVRSPTGRLADHRLIGCKRLER